MPAPHPSALLDAVRHDRTRGATELALLALRAVELDTSCAHAVQTARPSMPLIAAAVRLARRTSVAEARRRIRRSEHQIVLQAIRALPRGLRAAQFGGSRTVARVLRAIGARPTGRPDIAFVGADALLPDGAFVNARGTARFARRIGAPLVVVASLLKRVRRPAPLEPGFEIVPASLAAGWLDERGLRWR